MARRAGQGSVVLLVGALAWAWPANTTDALGTAALTVGGPRPFGGWPVPGYGAVVAGWPVLSPRLHRCPAA